MFKTIITFPEEIKEKIEKICSDIKVTSEGKGESFDYRLEGNKLIVIKKRRNTAYAVGFWFRQRGIYSEDEKENRRWRRKIHFEVLKVRDCLTEK